ncbi:MAG: DNA primase [Polyangiaceae bacterium]|nr:DNA primase [Polyangiaceae bacterium]
MISPETIALVRERTDILAIITEAVPSLKRRGRSWVGLCPFHKEKSPSFHVNPDRGFFHCFGCKESGSAIDFLLKHEGYTFPEAVRALAERAGIAIEETHGQSAFSEADRQRKAREDLYAVNALAATYFEEQLRLHEHRGYAMEELSRRALTPGHNPKIDDTLQAFRIGYAPPGWDGLANFLRAQRFSPVAAETVGLLVPRSSGSGYYDRFRHRLMFAVVDPQGRVVAFSGRALPDLPDASHDDESKPPKYINSPESPIYTKGQMLFGIHQARHAIRKAECAVLVEGNFDVVSLHARGIDNVVAPLGTAFTVEQAKLIRRFASNVIFLFDGDAAGCKAVTLSREAVRAAGLDARVAKLPNGVDPDELAREKGEKAVRDLVANAMGMFEALVQMALDESFTLADANERYARVEHVKKLLGEENDPVLYAMHKSFADMMAGRLDIVRSGGQGAFRALDHDVKQLRAKAEAARRAQAGEHASGGAHPAKGTASRIAPRAPGSAERQAMVEALIEWPVLLDDPEVAEELSLLEGRSVMIVAALRRAYRSSEKALDTETFLSNLSPSDKIFAARRMADPATESNMQAKGYLLENANKLKRLLLSQETALIARENYRAQDWEIEQRLMREATSKLRAKHGIKP